MHVPGFPAVPDGWEVLHMIALRMLLDVQLRSLAFGKGTTGLGYRLLCCKSILNPTRMALSSSGGSEI